MRAPENTLAAFAAAIDAGADAIELDVHLSRDGVPVVHHDYFLGRTNEGRGWIGDQPLEALRALSAGRWFGEAFAAERIPTLAEALVLGRGRIGFEIELKCWTPQGLAAVGEEIRRSGIEDVEITSEHVALLAHASREAPSLRLGAFFGPGPDWMTPAVRQRQIADTARLLGVRVVHASLRTLDAELVAALQQDGRRVHAAPIDTEADLATAIARGVDQLSTDRLAVVIGALGPRPPGRRSGSLDQPTG